jgi:molecular chaperone GrpE
MWEAPPPDTAGDALVNGQTVLTPAAIESVLADFRSWLQHLSSAPPSDEEAGEPAQPLDLHTLLGQSIALRQEVNLQTKASRSQQEQTGLALQQLSQALEALRQAQAAAQQANQQTEEEILRPLLKTLLDVHDAFSLAAREIRRAPETILPLLDELVLDTTSAVQASSDGEPESRRAPSIPSEADLEREADPALESAPPSSPSLWQRLFARRRDQGGAGSGERRGETLARLEARQQRLRARLEEQRQLLVAQHEHYERLLRSQRERKLKEQAVQQEHQEKVRRGRQRLGHLLDSVLTGYRMSLQRLERALEKSGLEPIPCVGQPFNPEQMEVVAAVADSGRPAGEVIEEVHRGYLWHGRVFRYAQVSVAKS